MSKESSNNEVKRCSWCLTGDPEYRDYHDLEWGRPVQSDRIHFEFLVLESAQAGLSWLTIFKRREAYRKAFADFDPVKVADFDEHKVQELLATSQIIRHEKKIRSAIQNAKAFLKVQKEWGSFNAYIWSFVQGKPVQGKAQTLSEVSCLSETSVALSKDLKKRGFAFVGPKIVYSHMQATGLINDHLVDCFCYQQCQSDAFKLV
jgi:DNA-3-methyladenine glycosylase I